MGLKRKIISVFLFFLLICNLFSSDYNEGEVIVKYKNILKVKTKSEIYPSMYVEKNYEYLSSKIGSSILLLKSDTLKTEEIINRLKNDPNVEFVEPNYIRKLFLIPNDPFFSQQWGLNNTGQSIRGKIGTPDADIDAIEAWDITTGSSDIVVAVIDTGVDYNHPDLSQNIWINTGEIPNNGVDDDNNGYIDDYYGYNFVDENGNPMDDVGHGTHVAGIIGAIGNNGIGVSGVNWKCKIMPLKAGSSYGFLLSDIIEAIEYVIMMKEKGVNIVAINASYGGYYYSDVERLAIDTAGKSGIVFVAASGNDSNNNDITPVYPASYDCSNIISVAATDQDDNLANFSNYGINTVDLGAPGVSILSTVPNNTYNYYDGTSMAAPFVTGAVAIVSSFFPGYNVSQKIQKILSSVDKIPSLNGKVKTGGRLNLYNIVSVYYEELTGDVYYIKNKSIYKKSLSTNSITQLTYLPGDIISQNISEDGEKIIFTYKDGLSYQLYSINSDGSGLENISDTYNLNKFTKNQKYGVLSPDGDILAFVAESIDPNIKGENLYIKELNGQKRLFQLTNNDWTVSYPTFIDENNILFKARNNFDPLEDYYIISTNGANLRNITNNNQYSPYFPKIGKPSLSYRKTQIIYSKQTNTNNFYSNWEVYLLNISDGSEVKVLTDLYFDEEPKDQRDPMPFLIGDTQILFVGKDPVYDEYSIFITNIGSNSPYLRKVDDPNPLFYSLLFPSYFVPLPKPTQLLYVKDGQIWKKVDTQNIKLTDTINSNNDPLFDISGNYITFSGNGIWFGKSNGTDYIQIESKFNARYPAISPDGKFVIYVKDNDIYARKTDLSYPSQRLTYTPTISKIDLSFSPDGKKIIYSAQTSSGFQIFYLPITIFDTFIRVDGNPINLTNLPGTENYNPRFTIDGEYIYFVSLRDGIQGIYKMKSDGSECIKLNISQINPSYPVPSPYGKNEIIYLSEGNIYKFNMDKNRVDLVASLQIYNKIDWAILKTRRVETKRQFIYRKADPNTQFAYYINIDVNILNQPTSIILEEILPVGWNFIKAEIDGKDFIPDYNQNGILKWLLMKENLKSGTIKIYVSPENKGIFNGGFYDGLNYWTTKGDSYIETGKPPIPFDFDENFEISDEELLNAIEYWAKNERYNGWPEDIGKWDEWLLKIINFWVKGSYNYIGNYDWR